MAKVDAKLPDDWIRKESSTRPNRFYYFNTKTGKSQWDPPNSKLKTSNALDEHSKPTKSDAQYKNRSSVQHRLKISDKSKDVKKIKTPAQDRLQKLVKKKLIAENVTEQLDRPSSKVDKPTSVPNSDSKRLKLPNIDASAKLSLSSAKITLPSTKNPLLSPKTSTDQVDSAESEPNVDKHAPLSFDVNMRVNDQKVSQIKKSSPEKLPALLKSKTPAQDRLIKLQKEASIKNIAVFESSFGLNGTTQSTISENMDEEMEWEDCGDESADDPTYSFQELEDMVVEVEANSSQLVHIVPDTNVFLDSLAPIKCIVERDPMKCLLVPFVVLQELDGLKSRRDAGVLNSKASRAIRYIYDQLKAKNQRMQGQKATEDNAPIINVKCADDKILNCCLQLQHKSSDVILLTNDINLSNKAIMNGIEAMTSKQFLDKFE